MIYSNILTINHSIDKVLIHEVVIKTRQIRSKDNPNIYKLIKMELFQIKHKMIYNIDEINNQTSES